MKIVKDKKYPGMYRVSWEDGTYSVPSQKPKPWKKGGHYGFYNKSRAKEFLRKPGIEDLSVGLTWKGSVVPLEGH